MTGKAGLSEYEVKAKRLLLFSSVFLLALGVLVLFFKYLFLPLLPFTTALLISWPVLYFADLLNKKTKIHKKVWTLILLLLFTALFFAFASFCVSKLIGELYRLVGGEGELITNLSNAYDDVLSFLAKHFPKLTGRIADSGFENRLYDFISAQSGEISLFLARAAIGLPGVVFFAIVTFLASYYFACDNRRIKDRISAFLPDVWDKRLRRLFRAAKKSFVSYLRAGGYMMLLTFFEVLIGLILLRVSYPILLALLVSALDFLPVLGTGVILAPMGAVALIRGDLFTGFGLIMLWGVTTLVRQLVEPKIVGKSLGIHPLFSLFSCYVGFKLLGAAGLILLPIVFSVLGGVIKEYERQTERTA